MARNSYYDWAFLAKLRMKSCNKQCFKALSLYYSFFTEKDGYNIKGKPVQGAIQQNTYRLVATTKDLNTIDIQQIQLVSSHQWLLCYPGHKKIGHSLPLVQGVYR